MASHLEFDAADLERQVRALGREVAKLRKSLVEQGSGLYRDDAAANYYAQRSDMVSSNLPTLLRHARSLDRSIYNHSALVTHHPAGGLSGL